jgi:uncharacterized protein YndB with AHSA1/START domain
MEDKNELLIERAVDASPEAVWEAWTDPDMLKQWWGPNGVTIPECEVDLRIPGKFYIVMEAGEAMGPYKGIKWPMLGKFTVIEPNSKLSYDAQAWTEGQKGETTIDQTTELTLTEDDSLPAQAGKTRVKIMAVVHKIGPGAKMAVEGMQAGFAQQLDKLNDFLAAAQKI